MPKDCFSDSVRTAVVAVLCVALPALARFDPGVGDKALVLDGSTVLTAGHLHVNITNWGLIGSHYSVPSSYFGAPSAQWPGGSGEEYLFAAGLWIGGRQWGVTSVTCGQPESEMRPPLGVEYVMYEGREGVQRRPTPSTVVAGTPADLAGGDDDEDGRADEDRLDGRDNDQDGRVDEDFRQLGSQMLTCIMRDDDPLIEQMFPDHRPLNLEIYLEAMAWDTPGNEDAVGLRWTVKNVGPQPIYDIYAGLLVDGDIGRHDDPDAGIDDLAGSFEGLVRQREGYWEDFDYVWMRDADPVHALTGWLGAAIDGSGLGDPDAVRPEEYGTCATRILDADFSSGEGVPFLDGERYALLSQPGRDRDIPDVYPADYLVFQSVGPYEVLKPGEYIVIEAILTVGQGPDELQRAMRRARDLAAGRWYNADGSWASGGGGRETLFCAEDFRLPWDAPSNPLYRKFPSYWDESCKPPGLAAGFPLAPEDLTWYPDLQKHCVWISTDNCDECRRYHGRECTVDNPGLAYCYGSSARTRGACTGYSNREAKIPFVTRSFVPPPPLVRLAPADRGLEVYWDDRSERTPDPQTGQVDFESYRVWRSDHWDRPAGTSEETGPPVLGWNLVDEFDLVNFLPQGVYDLPRAFGRNTGLEVVAYRPVCLDDPRFEGLDQVMADLDLEGYDELPPLRDTAGQPVPGLEPLLPWEGHPAELDTFFFSLVDSTRYYRYWDGPLHNGFVYFYAVTATDHVPAADGVHIRGPGDGGLPSGSFAAGIPRVDSTSPDDAERVYVYPNPATRQSLAEFQALHPNADDPTGVRVSFANLPACQSRVDIFTLAGDLVQTIDHDGSGGDGQASWNLITRNGQEVVSGIYLFVVQPEDGRFSRSVGKFVVIR